MVDKGLNFAVKNIGLFLRFCSSLLKIAQVQQTVLGKFSGVAYSNNNGTQSFTTDWSQTSGETGTYGFTLRPRRYVLKIELPEHYRFSPVYAGDAEKDSDIQPTGQSGVLELGWNQHLKSIDIG